MMLKIAWHAGTGDILLMMLPLVIASHYDADAELTRYSQAVLKGMLF